MGLTITPYGDTALLVTWAATGISRNLLDAVSYTCDKINTADIPGIIDCNTGYNSMVITYNPSLTSFLKLQEIVDDIIIQKDVNHHCGYKSEIKTWTIPVNYHASIDMSKVEKATSLSREEIINIHCSVVYDVHFIGFLPGFLYLGGLDKRLYVERLSRPRGHTPAGSVAIAANQTGIYPTDSPGGWHIIGHTDFKIFNPASYPPMNIKSGDKIVFQPLPQ